MKMRLFAVFALLTSITSLILLVLNGVQPALARTQLTPLAVPISPLATGSMGTTYYDDFGSYAAGMPPAGWLLRGATEITPAIEDVGGAGPAYRLVSFPEVPWQYWDKWLIRDSLVLGSSYTVTVKLNFQNTVADRAGLTIAWNDTSWNRIDIQPNVYWDSIEFRVSYNGPITSNVVVTNVGYIPVNAFTDYWLRAEATDYGPGQGKVTVYWSTDNISFRPVVTTTGLAELTGLAGVSTAGPHLPHTHFDDFEVISDVPTAIGLLYFRVDSVQDRHVDLGWATAVEIDNFGFQLYRGQTDDLHQAEWIHFAPSAIKGSGTGATYAYHDIVPHPGEWWYWLADVDTRGRETLHPPISVLIGVMEGGLPFRLYLPIITSGWP